MSSRTSYASRCQPVTAHLHSHATHLSLKSQFHTLTSTVEATHTCLWIGRLSQLGTGAKSIVSIWAKRENDQYFERLTFHTITFPFPSSSLPFNARREPAICVIPWVTPWETIQSGPWENVYLQYSWVETRGEDEVVAHSIWPVIMRKKDDDDSVLAMLPSLCFRLWWLSRLFGRRMGESATSIFSDDSLPPPTMLSSLCFRLKRLGRLFGRRRGESATTSIFNDKKWEMMTLKSKFQIVV